MLKRLFKKSLVVAFLIFCVSLVSTFTVTDTVDGYSQGDPNDSDPGEVVAGVSKADPGFLYQGTSRDWWPAYDYYYIESPEIKFTVGTVSTATHDPVDWSNNTSGNNKWGSLTPGHMMDAVPKLSMSENLDFTEFVLSDDLGVSPEDEANGKYMEWSWFHPLTMLKMPDISIDNNTIVANGGWYNDENMESSVRYSIVEGTPLIKMEITLDNRTGADFNGDFGYIIDPDQPGGQQTYIPGKGWVYSQVNKPIKSGWEENYVFNGVNNTFTGKTAHAIIWPEEQQPTILLNNAIFEGVWFDATIPDGQSKKYVLYHMPHIAGPADKPYAVAEFWAKVIRENSNPGDYGSITGSITDETGAPVAFTQVDCIDASGNTYAKAVTNSDGKYQLYAKKGIYEIVPRNEEYSVESKTIEIGDVTRVKADFIMKKYADITISLPSDITAGSLIDIGVMVKNLTENTLKNVTLHVQTPYFIELLDEGQTTIPVIEPNSQFEIKIKGVALEGGRSTIKANVYSSSFNITGKSSFDVKGEGYYGGDNHTHTTHSDGVNSVAQNADSVYNKRLLSWVWNTDHNTFSQKEDADDVTRSYNGNFLSLAGTEITTSVGHALVYGLDSVPRYDINNDLTSGYTWQDSINDVTGNGGLFYIAHPFDQTYTFQDLELWRGFTGVEVWNGNRHALDDGVNERAFRFWDEINIRGDGKYYGIANTDGHTKDKVGDTNIVGQIPNLSGKNVLKLLKTGNYYGTNGPKIRFNINGVGMGKTLKIEDSGESQFNIQAYDPNSNLTNIRLIKYPVTGDINDYSKREIVFEQDLTEFKTDTFIKTINLLVQDKEFYRLEVQSEKAKDNSTGIGPQSGTGFAFSNPIWVHSSENSNALGIESIRYNGKNNSKVFNHFGINYLKVFEKDFDPKRLEIRLNRGATVTSKSYSKITNTTGILNLTVLASDGSLKEYKYVVKDPEVTHMKKLIKRFEDEGEITNHGVAQSLKAHLNTVEHFVKQDKVEKVIKHMKGFKLLLLHHKEKELISDNAYNILNIRADSLIEEWRVDY